MKIRMTLKQCAGRAVLERSGKGAVSGVLIRDGMKGLRYFLSPVAAEQYTVPLK